MGGSGGIVEYFKRISMNDLANNKERLFIIKIGGNVIDDSKNLDSFIQEFANIEGKKILVHGGGKIATAIGEKSGIQSKYIDGRRITDDGWVGDINATDINPKTWQLFLENGLTLLPCFWIDIGSIYITYPSII